MAAPDRPPAGAAAAGVDVDPAVDRAGRGDLGLVLGHDADLGELAAAGGTAARQRCGAHLVDHLGDRSAGPDPVGRAGRPARAG